MRLVKAHHRASRRYRPRPYPGKVTYFRARDSRILARSDPRLGWDEVAGGGLDVHVVPGDHHRALGPPHVEAFADALRACLREAQRPTLTQPRPGVP